MKQNIYRKEALARLASPEQLDQLMPLTSPRGWLALATAALLLLAGILWLIFGTISVKVEGPGVLQRSGGVRQITAPEGGMVVDIAVHPGDEVHPTQEVLRLTSTTGESQPQPAGAGSALREGQQDAEKPAYITRPVASKLLGRVLEVAVQPRDTVEAGTLLVTLEPLDQPLQAVLYLSAADAYRVERGMEVQIRAVTAGSASSAILGRVQRAARYPATRSQMLRTLGSDELVSALTKSGPRLEVVIEALAGSEKVLNRLFSGTPCRAQITLHQQSPIHLLLPAPEKPPEL